MRNKKRIIAAVTVVIMLFLTLYAADLTNRTLMRKVSRDRMQDLIEGETNTDILLIGNSHIMDGVIPMELWKEYGYASHLLCAEYNDMERYPAMLELALQYTDPSLVVVDVDNYWEKSPDDKTLMGYHEFADAYPLTKTKIRTTLELYPDMERRREILFPFYLYHSRWNDLSRNDLKKSDTSNYLKGYEYSTKSIPVEIPEIVPQSEGVLLEDAYGLAALRRLIADCKERGIPVLLVTIPYAADVPEQQYLQGLHTFAQENGVSYLNLIPEESLVDESTDYGDAGHLNALGAEKVTGYLGKYIGENYDIPVRSEEEPYRTEWNKYYEEYQDFLKG